MTAHGWLLAAFLAGGAFLRAGGLTDHGLWIDEYGTWWTLAGDGWADCWERVLAIHGQSPLYYLIVRASSEWLGPGTLALRLPSLVFGVGLLALSYPLAHAIFRDRRVALLAVAAFAVDARLIYYSQEARLYGLALLCAAGSFTAYARLLDGGGRLARLGYLLATMLTWYAHYLFGVVVAVQLLHLALQRPWRGGAGRVWLGTYALLALLMAPGLAQVASLFGRRQSLDWINAPAGPFAGLGLALDLLDPWILGVVVVASLLAGARWADLQRLWRAGHAGAVVAWLVVPFLLFAVLAPAVGIQLLHSRYATMALPAVPLLYAALLALPASGPRRLALRALPTAAFLCLALALRVAPLVQRTGGDFWWYFQHDWQGAISKLVGAHREGDLILYRTGFVELDEMVRGHASATTVEFVEWPVLAHLPPGREFRRHPLPYRDAPEMRERVASLLRATSPRRVWVVGIDPADPPTGNFRALLEMARSGQPLRVERQSNHGVVHIFLLRPDGSAP